MQLLDSCYVNTEYCLKGPRKKTHSVSTVSDICQISSQPKIVGRTKEWLCGIVEDLKWCIWSLRTDFDTEKPTRMMLDYWRDGGYF